MNWIELGRKWPCPNFRYCPSIWFEELKKYTYVREASFRPRPDPRITEIQSRIGTHSGAASLVPHILITILATAIYFCCLPTTEYFLVDFPPLRVYSSVFERWPIPLLNSFHSSFSLNIHPPYFSFP
jgi:hypothetical protein